MPDRTSSLRRRNRIRAMRDVQAAAIDLFEGQGFDATTIESIARASGVSASTIYRHFGTKEQIVLWDEREHLIDEELGRRLGTATPLEALRDASIVALAERDDEDDFLRCVRLSYAEPAIWAAGARKNPVHRRQLAAGIARSRGRSAADLADECAAAVCLAALDVALDSWQRSDGASDLRDVLVEAFGVAGAVG